MICCPLSSGDGEGPSCYRREDRKARKSHVCCECREAILAGQQYEYVSGIWDGRPSDFKTCLSCREIRDHFSCTDSRGVIGELWTDLEANFFPDMKAGGPCMEGLSPAAKQRLFDLRMRWYEEENS